MGDKIPDTVQRQLMDVPCLHGIVLAGLNGMGTWRGSANDAYGVLQCGDFIICAGVCGVQAEALLSETISACTADELILYGPAAWLTLADHLPDRCGAMETRWAFSSEVQPSDDVLTAMLQQRPEMCFHAIEGERISWCRSQAWTRDFVSCYRDDDLFAKHGLGVLAEADGRLVSGASSYVSYPGGIEIQVQTHDGDEGHGYAMAASAALILKAHRRGLKATWDAANPASAHIAQRLGYACTGTYPVKILKKSI